MKTRSTAYAFLPILLLPFQVACSSGDSGGPASAGADYSSPAGSATPAAGAATAPSAPTAPSAAAAAITAADLTGNWGHTSMGEDPDGPVSISFAADGSYTAKVRSGGVDDAQSGKMTFFTNETDAAKIVSFVGDVPALPPGDYVLLRFAEDGADLYRVSLSADKKQLSFEAAAAQRGQGLHATGQVGPKDTLDKDFNNPQDPGVTAASLTGDWGRSSMAEGPDGPVSITFKNDGTYTAKVRDNDLDSGQQGSFKVLPTANDADALVSFVGDVPKLPDGTYVLLQFDVDAADLYRVSLSADGNQVTFESAAAQRGQGLHATGTLAAAISLTKNFNQ